MPRRTKIVCTLGPAVDSLEAIRALIAAGMNVARINCSHGDWPTRRRWIQWIRESGAASRPVAILVDLQGPKFRVGEVAGGSVELEAGQVVSLGERDVVLPIRQPEILGALGPGSRLLLGDGNVELRVRQQEGSRFLAVVVSGGTVRSRQGLTVVGRVFETPALTEKDLADVEEALAVGADYIALSYVRRPADCEALRALIQGRDPRVRICAKIETRDAFLNLEPIVEAVDLVMVARGDLGLQMDIEDVPIVQKRIIDKCSQAGKPVITATQMLESMISSPRPTRAEATDIANAVLDGTDALMLSAETATGKYPLACVKMMAKVAAKAESLYDRSRIDRVFSQQRRDGISHTEAVAHAVAELAAILRPRAILTNTTSGQTARLVSKFRPRVPILCATYDQKTQAQLAVVWGIEAAHLPVPASTDEAVGAAIAEFVAQGRLKTGDLVIVTAGVPAGVPGNTNLILTRRV